MSLKKVKVLHVITRMIRGGAQENTLATCRGLIQKGYEVTLVTGPTRGNEGEIISEAIAEGVPVVIIPELIREVDLLKDFIALTRLLALLAKSNYAIIHTHTSKSGFLGRMAAYLRRIPIVIHTPHGHVFHSYFSPWKESLFLFIERKAAQRCDRLVALTQVEQQEHLKLAVGNPEKWVTIPSGINEKQFHDISFQRKQTIRALLGIPAGRKIVGFLGRLAPVKGARYLVEAIPQIRQTASETHFLFIGDGEERNVLEQKIQEMGVGGWVTFAGHQKNVSEFLAVFDILVVPSLNEGMGRVIAEGGLLKKPVIAARIGGILDLIEEMQTGLLVTPRSSEKIANAVIRLLKDAPLCQRLGDQLQKKVLEGFTESQMVDQIDRLYQELLTQKEILFPEVTRGEWSFQQPTLSGHSTASR